MSVLKSFVLSSAFPSSRTGLKGLKTALEYIEPYHFPVIEYYCENCHADDVRSLIGKRKSIFLAAALQKAKGLNPSSTNTAERKRAVDELSECMKFARQAGAGAVLINSGPRPENEQFDSACLSHLKNSICELHHQVKETEILLEPGDRDVEYRHLIGQTEMAVSFIKDIRPEVPCIGLVFDMSHIAQLKEELYSSWTAMREFCAHVHLANCVLNRHSSLYGDKHPLFGIKDGVYSHKAAGGFFNFLKDESISITAGIEVICSEKSEKSFFERLVSTTGWFFE